jgi:hypothetical protein
VEKQLRELERSGSREPETGGPKSEVDASPDRPFTSPAPEARSQEADIPVEEPTSESEPSTTSDDPSTGVPMEFSDFERAWPAIVAQIRQDVGPRRHALLKEASPVGIENGAVVFEVAAHMHFHLEQLKADDGIAAAISAAGVDHLGQPITVTFRSSDIAAPAKQIEVERAPDKDDLREATGDTETTVIDNVLDVLGGEIVGD